ncbi:MAG: hypothetical protein H0U03_11730, partial [Actinobacteria bacterium]|nr:hypothetical protein [Actinomycetota bacterium]
MKRVCLIVNPYASGVTADRVRAVERALAGAGSISTLETQGRGHATELARAACNQADAIVVYSGDGGFNEVLNGVDGHMPVGFIPGGGTSVLPRALGMPRDPEASARRLAHALASNRTRRISLGRANGRRFGFTAGVGLDAELVRRVDAMGRASGGRRPGDRAFAWTLVRLLAERRGRFPPALDVRGYGRAAFALVANGNPYTYLGRLPLRVAPEARFELGLDLVAPSDVRPRSLVRLLVYAVSGRG